MAESHVVTALTYKYARLKGELDKHEADARDLKESLDHIEHVIRLFRKDWEPHFIGAVRPRKAGKWRYSVVGIRTAFEVLKRAERPLTALEIARRCVLLVDEPMPDKQRLSGISNSINQSLQRHIGRYVNREDCRPAKWSLMPPVSNIPSIDATDGRSSPPS
jgi:hypothetical protein